MKQVCHDIIHMTKGELFLSYWPLWMGVVVLFVIYVKAEARERRKRERKRGRGRK